MGRSGAGGGGGGFRSGGHSSGFRSSVHSGSSSSRSGAGRSSSSRSTSSFSSRPPMGGGFGPRPGGVSFHRHYHSGPSYGYSRTYRAGSLIGSLFTFVVLMFIIAVFAFIATSSMGPKSTINREKISAGYAFDRDCWVDDLGWINSSSKMTKALEDFWKETGVQPYVILTYEDSSTMTSQQKQDWAMDFAETYLEPNAFLIVYFDTGNSSVKGDTVEVRGDVAMSVMDSEAMDIYWNYFDSYWETWDPDDTSGMFVQIYGKTADTIMRVSTTGADVMKYVVMAIILIVVIVGVVVIMNKKRAAERARAEETERILQAGQNQQTYGPSSDPSMDELTSRYDD